MCGLPKDSGQCKNFSVQWYFDVNFGSCSRFWYGGCGGNGNNFKTVEECEIKCVDVCTLPKDPGPCLGYYRMWYYDSSDNNCRSFVYGGCEGNGNKFGKKTDCEATCVMKTAKVQPPVTHPTGRATAEEVCRLPVDPGPCNESHPRWFYDVQSRNCLPFVFGGCNGNRNRFKTSEICLKFCTGITATTLESLFHEKQTSPIPEPKQCPASNCADLQCPYGTQESFDTNGCSSCKCSNPCEVQNCPDGSRCAIEVSRTLSELIVVCRKVTKPGICPAVTDRFSSSAGDCETRCRDDADCRGDHKCCNNGCAKICVPLDSATRDLLIEPAHIIPGPNVAEGYIGEPIELPCNAVGWPKPIVTWWRDITMLPLSNRQYELLSSYALLIRSVAFEDAGQYSCHVHNGIGSGAIFEVTLKIVPKPEPVTPSGREEPDFNSADSKPVSAEPFESEAVPDTTCIDNPQFSNCEVVVRNSYCSNKYFGKFCCASCMKAGQLAAPPDE
ncbi:unnamed protein product [Larinioides sclopetarius]|uniref:Papilin n=1 Tax=Larinioides sclopetarius TaxID=280406 RepID=A0AAV1Z5W6_9ARAC